MKYKLQNKALLICCCIALAGIPTASYAEYPQNNSAYANANYYDLGMDALKQRNYNNAIEYLKQALAKDPSYSSARNNLAVAYTSRGNYYFNQGIDLEKAANDFRLAIYYLKYYDKASNTEVINENIDIALLNLDNVLTAQKAPKDAASRLNKAKELRGQNELAASVIEYVYASKDAKYAYESNVALGDIMRILTNEYNAAVFYDKALAINSKDPYLHLKFGRTLYKLGNIDTAVKELDIAAEDNKTKLEALKLLETIWEDRVAQSPRNAIAHMNLGTIYQNEKKYDLAMVQYRTAQSLDPHNQMVKLNIATLYQAKGNYQDALAIYNELLKTKPDDYLINIYKAATLDKIGLKNEAISVYKKLLIANPTNANVKNHLLDTISELPDTSALNYLAELSAKFPNDAEIHYTYAYTLHKNKKYSLAIDEYQKSLTLDAKNLDAYLNLAAIQKQNTNISGAIETLNKAHSIYPNNEKIKNTIAEYNDEQAFSLLDKATNLYNKKDYNDAIIVYKSISNPTEDVFLGIGACYQAMERYDEAIANYTKAMALDPANPNSHYFIGLAYLYKKDYVNSEKYLKKAKELDSVNPDIADALKSLQFAKSEEIMNKGIQLFENNKNEEAIANFNKAITLCAENGYAYYYRGLVYDTKGQNQNAINDYKKAVHYNPELTMTYYSMALSYDALKNKVEAKKMYQKFINEYPTQDEYRQYAQQRLKEI